VRAGIVVAVALLAIASPGRGADGDAPVNVGADTPGIQVVTGTVRSARVEGSVVRLAFDDDPGSLRIILLLGWLSHFPPDTAHYYLGKTVRVRGVVKSFRGTPEMTVRDAADITVLGQSAGAATSAGTPPDELQSLREQVQRLEERVRQLERRDAERK